MNKNVDTSKESDGLYRY